MSESYAHSLMEEWKTKVEELDLQAEEAKRLERSASLSLESMVIELETSNGFLKKAETELSSLKEKVGLLEMSNVRQRGDLEESERNIQRVKHEAFEMTKKGELLKTEFETVKDERKQALDNEKLAASSVQNLQTQSGHAGSGIVKINPVFPLYLSDSVDGIPVLGSKFCVYFLIRYTLILYILYKLPILYIGR